MFEQTRSMLKSQMGWIPGQEEQRQSAIEEQGKGIDVRA